MKFWKIGLVVNPLYYIIKMMNRNQTLPSNKRERLWSNSMRKRIQFILSGILPVLIFLLVVPVSADEEKEGSLFLEWTRLNGVQEYMVQVRNQNNQIVLEKKVTDNKLHFSVPPGNYSQRVGAVNKFGKVSGWTDWTPFYVKQTFQPRLGPVSITDVNEEKREAVIRVEAKNLMTGTKFSVKQGDQEIPIKNIKRQKDGSLDMTVDLNKIEEGSLDDLAVEMENPGGKKDTSTTEDPENIKGIRTIVKTEEDGSQTIYRIKPKRWRMIVPGPYQAEESRWGSALLWGGIFAAYAGAGYSEYEAANGVSRSITSDPILSLYNNPYVLINRDELLPPVLNDTNLMFYYSNQIREARKEYDRHQQNQVYIGTASLLTYSGYLVYENRDAINWKSLVPGVPQIANDNITLGTAMIGLSTVSAIGAASEFSAANTAVNAAGNNYYYRLYNDPFYYYFSREVLPSDTILTVSVMEYLNFSKQQQAYKQHESNAIALTGSSILFYLVHLIDASLFEDPVVHGDDEYAAPSLSFGAVYTPDGQGNAVMAARWRF